MSWLVGDNGEALTSPDTQKRKRELLEAMMQRYQQPQEITHPMQGIAQLVGSLGTAMQLRKAEQQEAKQYGDAQGAFSKLMTAFGNRGGGQAMPQRGVGGQMQFAPEPVMPVAPGADEPKTVAGGRERNPVVPAPPPAPAGGGKGPVNLRSYLAKDKGISHVTRFNPDFSDRMSAMLRDAPGGVSIFSGYRSPEHQAQLWARALKRYGSAAAARKWVAPPGRSKHNHGTAADLRFANNDVKRWVHENAGRYGLRFRMGHEPWHIELSGGAAIHGGGGSNQLQGGPANDQLQEQAQVRDMPPPVPPAAAMGMAFNGAPQPPQPQGGGYTGYGAPFAVPQPAPQPTPQIAEPPIPRPRPEMPMAEPQAGFEPPIPRPRPEGLGGEVAPVEMPQAEPLPQAQPLPQMQPRRGPTEFQRMMARSLEKQGGTPDPAMLRAIAGRGGSSRGGGGWLANLLGSGRPTPEPEPDMSEVNLEPPPVAAAAQQNVGGDGAGQIDIPTILQFMAMPGATPEQKQIARMLFEQEIARSDPAKQMELRKLQLEIEKMENPEADPMNQIKRKQAELDYQQDLNAKPERKTVVVDGRLIDATTGQEIYAAPPGSAKPVTVGGRLVNPETGAVVYEPPPDEKDALDIEKKRLDIEAAKRAAAQEADPLRRRKLEVEIAKTEADIKRIEDDIANPSGGISIDKDGNVQIGGKGGPKLTESQSKDVNYYNRASQVAPLLAMEDEVLTNLGSNIAGNLGVAGNYFKSTEYQRAEQLGREFLSTILRKDTGAAVTQTEFDIYGKMYLPQPGDDAATVQRKRDARARAVEGLRMGLGAGQILFRTQKELDGKTPGPDAGVDPMVQDVDKQELPKAAPNPSNLKRPESFPQESWDGLTTEQRARVIELSGGR